MSTPELVEQFYSRIWNEGDLAAADELLTDDFVFRGSLGIEISGIEAFNHYVGSVRGALTDYECVILDCVVEDDKAFAKMRFSGVHTGVFCGHQPTGKRVQWLGAALFTFEGHFISELWVLGDLASLDAVLQANAQGL